MKTIRAFVCTVLAAAAALLSATAAAQNAGTVQFASGTVEIQRGAPRIAAQKGTALLQGDTVVTPAASSAQLVMADGALVSLRPSTQMATERYEFDEAKASAGEAMLALARGTIRTFTGLDCGSAALIMPMISNPIWAIPSPWLELSIFHQPKAATAMTSPLIVDGSARRASIYLPARDKCSLTFI